MNIFFNKEKRKEFGKIRGARQRTKMADIKDEPIVSRNIAKTTTTTTTSKKREIPIRKRCDDWNERPFFPLSFFLTSSTFRSNSFLPFLSRALLDADETETTRRRLSTHIVTFGQPLVSRTAHLVVFESRILVVVGHLDFFSVKSFHSKSFIKSSSSVK